MLGVNALYRPNPPRSVCSPSVPSSALADMLRTADERWPAAQDLPAADTRSRPVEAEICRAVLAVGQRAEALGIEALVLARGGGSREDLAVFDGEVLGPGRWLSALSRWSPAWGHEDDTTIAGPWSLTTGPPPRPPPWWPCLPDRGHAQQELTAIRQQLSRQLAWRLRIEQQQTTSIRERLYQCHPQLLLQRQRQTAGP